MTKKKRAPKPSSNAWLSKLRKDEPIYCFGKYLNPKEARTLAAWLIKAANYLEQQTKGKKK